MSPVITLVHRIPHTCARIKSAFIYLLLIAVCFGTSRIASAQTDVGYILGTVTDQTGAAVSGATVTITRESTGLPSAKSPMLASREFQINLRLEQEPHRVRKTGAILRQSTQWMPSMLRIA
jgi:hypothetical protein